MSSTEETPVTAEGEETKENKNVANTAASAPVFVKPQVPVRNLERQEEAKLRAKYPGLKGPGSSAFLQKRLFKGQKYFDSGDYNMAKARGNSKPLPTSQKLVMPDTMGMGDTIPTPDSVPQRKASIHTQSKLVVTAQRTTPS